MTRKRWLWSVALGGCTIASSAGCTTIKSTEVKKDPSGCGWTTKKYRGMPITVKVPSSIRLTIKETRYYSPDGSQYLTKGLKWVPGSTVPSHPLASPGVTVRPVT